MREALLQIRSPLGRDAFFKKVSDVCKEPAMYGALCDMLREVPKYGRWKDLLVIWESNSELRSYIDTMIFDQFQEDQESEEPSLLAKWLPREKSNPALANHLATLLFPLTPVKERLRKYRKTVAYLTKKLDVTEVKMCAGKWSEINPDNIPRTLMTRCKKAFLNHGNLDRRYLHQGI